MIHPIHFHTEVVLINRNLPVQTWHGFGMNLQLVLGHQFLHLPFSMNPLSAAKNNSKTDFSSRYSNEINPK
jgi:hypothetical protein